MTTIVTTEKQTALDVAKSLVHGDRNADYGHPLDDFTRTAKMWSAILGIEVKPEQVPLMMICVKLSRLTNDITKRDSIIDVAGYAETLDMVLKEQQRRSDNKGEEIKVTVHSEVINITDLVETISIKKNNYWDEWHEENERRMNTPR